MAADELPRFFKALDEEQTELMRDLFATMLLTGARRANVCAMKWSDVSLEQAVWTIPHAQAKAGDQLRVHLPPPLVSLLRERKGKAESDSAYVFPGRAGGPGHITEPKAAWAALLERAGIADLRLHDLRRTLGSWAAATGASLPIIGKGLGHKSQATTAIYARLNLSPVVSAFDSATQAMLAAAKTTSKKKIFTPTKKPKGKH
jgi:integrase